MTNVFVKLVRLFGVITKKFVTMHDHTNVKKMYVGKSMSELQIQVATHVF